MKNKLTVLALASITLLPACSKQQQMEPSSDTSQVASTSIKQGQGKAVVRAIDTTTKTITLDHTTVPGIMEAMTMEYPVSDPAILHGVRVGDSVTFSLQDRGQGNYVVVRINPLSLQQP